MLRTLTYVLGKEVWQGCTWRTIVESVCFFHPVSFLWGLNSECQAPLPTG